MHTLLASDESEVGAEFQNEGFQFSKDGVLNVLFDVVTGQSEKVRKTEISEDHVGG